MALDKQARWADDVAHILKDRKYKEWDYKKTSTKTYECCKNPKRAKQRRTTAVYAVAPAVQETAAVSSIQYRQ